MEGQAGCSGHVEARDLTEYKVSLIEENIERMGLCNVTAVCQDASVYDEKSAGKADIVIADLPCSGLGVLGKKTDLKYKASPEGIVSLVKLQRKILYLRGFLCEAGRRTSVQYVYCEPERKYRKRTLVFERIS
mgnify:FL=1